jgi:hypothetical protein
MGPIYDRSQEHLGTSDSAIIRVRKRLMDSAKAFMAEGAPSPGVLDPAVYQVRGAAALLPKNADWVKSTEEIRRVIPGVNPSAPAR